MIRMRNLFAITLAAVMLLSSAAPAAANRYQPPEFATGDPPRVCVPALNLTPEELAARRELYARYGIPLSFLEFDYRFALVDGHEAVVFDDRFKPNLVTWWNADTNDRSTGFLLKRRDGHPYLVVQGNRWLPEGRTRFVFHRGTAEYCVIWTLYVRP